MNTTSRAAPDPVALEQRLHQHVDRLAGLIGPRWIGKPAALQATVKLIETELVQSGYAVRHETYVASGASVSNLIVEITGTRTPERVFIVGAHYDSLPTTPGADDNASAVAALLEIAHMLHGCQPACTLRFIAFACEEPPHYHLEEMGSQHHARSCRTRNEQVVGMISLEMLGYFTDEPGSQKVPPTIPRWLHSFFPQRGNFLAAVGNLRSWRLVWRFRRAFRGSSRFPLLSLALPQKVEEIRRSDHGPFWDEGFPAIMLTDTSFLRNPHYHQPTDTPDTLDYARLTQVTLGIARALRRLVGAKPA